MKIYKDFGWKVITPLHSQIINVNSSLILAITYCIHSLSDIVLLQIQLQFIKKQKMSFPLIWHTQFFLWTSSMIHSETQTQTLVWSATRDEFHCVCVSAEVCSMVVEGRVKKKHINEWMNSAFVIKYLYYSFSVTSTNTHTYILEMFFLSSSIKWINTFT